MKNRILTGKYWDWASENKNHVKACEICDPTKLVWASSEHFWRFYGNFIILAYSRNSADKRKITKMTVESWKMVGFHFKKKEKKLQIKPDRMSYRNPGVNWIFGGQKLTFVLNLRLPEMSKISGFSWKSWDTDVHCPNDAGSRATLATERYHMSMVAF